MKKVCCIYQIQNIKNGNRYIGGTINYSHRRVQHLSDLKNKKHYSKLLQQDFINDGEVFFVFSIIEFIDDINTLSSREEFWIKNLKPEYNTTTRARGFDYIEDNVKSKISATVKELWKDDEYRKSHSKPRNWKNGVPNRRGVKLSDETKEKISQSNLGEKNPNYGKPRCQGFMDKMRKSYPGVVSPDGVIYSPIIGLNKFCNEHSLDSGGMSRLLQGKTKSYKGWKSL